MGSKDNVGLTMKYFILKPRGDDAYAIASRKAIQTYARYIEHINFKLAKDLFAWIGQEHINANTKEAK